MEGNWYLQVQREVRSGAAEGRGLEKAGRGALPVPTPEETVTPPPADPGRPRGTPRSAW